MIEKMEDENSLYLQLHKLTPLNSDGELDHILTTLWKTRRTGLHSLEKTRIQSLLNLSSLPEVDPVLACLRSVIRKWVHENLSGDDLLKLFPHDLPVELQTSLVGLLSKYRNQWKEELAREQQNILPKTSVSQRVSTRVPPVFTSFPTSEIPVQLWPRQDDPNGTSTPIIADAIASGFPAVSIQHDVSPPCNLANVPCLKSLTWTMENCNTAPANKVAIITLKLQDFSKSPAGEMEVKFQLNRDTLEAMLRSMTYISEQISSTVGTSSGPAQKKQKQ